MLNLLLGVAALGAVGYVVFKMMNTKEAPSVDIDPPKAPAEPAKAACGCGRSKTGYCVGLHKLSAEEWAVHPDNPSPAVAPVEAAPAPEEPKVEVAVAKPKRTRKPKDPAAEKKPRKKKGE